MILLLCAATLSACGLGDTATSAAAAAKTKAREIEQAREVQRQVVDDLQKANEQAAQRMKEAEAR
jgi:molybdenum cofactor biosynthesis enzyme MoaA